MLFELLLNRSLVLLLRRRLVLLLGRRLVLLLEKRLVLLLDKRLILLILVLVMELLLVLIVGMWWLLVLDEQLTSIHALAAIVCLAGWLVALGPAHFKLKFRIHACLMVLDLRVIYQSMSLSGSGVHSGEKRNGYA